MSYSGTIANQVNTREIPRDQWVPFLAEFTRENRGAHARLLIVGSDADLGAQVETENRPFEEATADVKDRECTVWILFGSPPGGHITHGVPGVAAVRELPASEGKGAVLEVESTDGTKNILELANPDAYELPPAPSGEAGR